MPSRLYFIVVVLTTLCILQHVRGDACTDACDAAYPGGLPVSMCGTDSLTHSTNTNVFAGANPCYAQCNVMSYYAGPCGCPNDCSSEYGRGECTINNGSGNTSISGCLCKEGWGGQDCSLPVYPNQCSLHGKLITTSDKGSIFPFDYCLCDDSFTGSDCSSFLPDIAGNAPWGTIFDDAKVWYTDEYKDDHPVYNISLFATIRIEVDVADYTNLLMPDNLYNGPYASANVYFDNGIVRENFTNVGIKIQGQGSRLGQKKNWGIKFNEFVKGQKLFGVEKLKFKSCSESDAYLKLQLSTEFMRAMGLPIYRSSFALMYINGIYSGLYFMREDIDTTFLESRFPGDGSGNLMQLYYNVHMGFMGSDDTYYREKVRANSLGVAENYYTQAEGNDDWSDFINFLYFFNSTSDSDFEKNVETVFDVKNYLRTLVVESFILTEDNIASGNNFFVYHLPVDSMTLFSYDHESVFLFDSNNQPSYNPDIFSCYETAPDEEDYEEKNPMLDRILTLPKYNSSYLSYYQTFVDSIFSSSSKEQPAERVAAMFQFVLPWVSKDKSAFLSNGITTDDFIFDTEQFISYLPIRYQSVSAQINKYRC